LAERRTHNNQGQVVGSTLDSNFNWSYGFIWQDGVMTDLNTLIPASSTLRNHG
jgi:probable HAF family extracellular repeat protein